MGVLLVVGIIIIFMICIKTKRPFDIKVLLKWGMSCANFFQMLLFVVLFGYGCIDFPRTIWKRGNLKNQQDVHAFHTSALQESIKKELESLTKCCEEVGKIIETDFNACNVASVNMCYLDQLQEEYRQCLTYCRTGLQITNIQADLSMTLSLASHADAGHASKHARHNKEIRNNRLNKVYGGNKDFMDLEDEIDTLDVKVLKKLRKQLLKGRRILAKSKSEYYIHATAYKEIRDYELKVHTRGWKRVRLFLSLSAPSRIVMRIVSVFLFLLSLVIAFGEVVMFINIRNPELNISPISMLLHIEQLHNFLMPLVFLLMAFMAVCALSVLLKIRLMNYYHLVRRLSDPPSLLFFACYCSMIISPMCNNVLVFLNAQGTNNTAYGQAVVVNFDIFGGYYFNVYFPIAIVLVMLISFFGLVDRILVCMRFKIFGMDNEENKEMVEQGRSIALSVATALENKAAAELRERLAREGVEESNINVPLSSSVMSVPSSSSSSSHNTSSILNGTNDEGNTYTPTNAYSPYEIGMGFGMSTGVVSGNGGYGYEYGYGGSSSNRQGRAVMLGGRAEGGFASTNSFEPMHLPGEGSGGLGGGKGGWGFNSPKTSRASNNTGYNKF